MAEIPQEITPQGKLFSNRDVQSWPQLAGASRISLWEFIVLLTYSLETLVGQLGDSG